MSVNFQIPPQSRLIPTSTRFSAAFNTPTVGVYDFTNTAANSSVKVIDLLPSTIYFIDRISVGGNITEAQFLEAINQFCFLFVKKKLNNRNLYQTSIPIMNYIDSGELSNFFWTDKRNDELQITFQGVLNQLPSMIGISPVSIQVSFNIWAIDQSYFTGALRDMLSPSIGQRNRR